MEDFRTQSGEAGGLPNIFSTKALPGQPSVRQDIQYAYKKLQLELRAAKNKAEIDGKKAEFLIKELHKTNASLKEKLSEQGEAMKQMQRALKNYQLIDMQQQRSLTRTATTADSQIRSLQCKLRDLELEHQKALDISQERLERSKRERQALKLALAAIASHAMGGSEATGDDLAADMEAALSEGSEPLPRNPGVWMQLKYELDSSGNLVVGTKAAGTAMKPFALDGARGVAALTAQVARLYRQRTDLSTSQKEGAQQIAHMQSILDNIDLDFSVVGNVLQFMTDQVQAAVAYCQLPLLDLDAHVLSNTPRKVSDRLRIVWQLIRQLCGGMLSLSGAVRSPGDAPVHPNIALYRFRQSQGPDERTGNQLFGEYDALLMAAMRIAADAAAAAPPPSRRSVGASAGRALMSRGGAGGGGLTHTAPHASSRPATSAAASEPIAHPTTVTAPAPPAPQAHLAPVAEEPKPVKQHGHAPGATKPTLNQAPDVVIQPEVVAVETHEAHPVDDVHVELSSPGIEGSTLEIEHDEDEAVAVQVQDTQPADEDAVAAEPDAACITADTSAKVETAPEEPEPVAQGEPVVEEVEVEAGLEQQRDSAQEQPPVEAQPSVEDIPEEAEPAQEAAAPAESEQLPAAEQPAAEAAAGLDSDDSMNAADEEFEPVYGE